MRLTALPRVAVLVPGHGNAERAPIVLRNLQRIGTMRIEWRCALFVYGDAAKDVRGVNEHAFSPCTVIRQEGFWMHHARAIPRTLLAWSDLVLMMIDGVEINADVNLNLLAGIMERNCLALAGPSCPSCVTKRLIRTDRMYARAAHGQTLVGRRVEYIDPQILMYTADAFRCLLRLIDLVGLQADPTGWSLAALQAPFCRARVGIVDVMSVEKRFGGSRFGSGIGANHTGKNTYSWKAALTTSRPVVANISQRFHLPMTNYTRVIDSLT